MKLFCFTCKETDLMLLLGVQQMSFTQNGITKKSDTGYRLRKTEGGEKMIWIAIAAMVLVFIANFIYELQKKKQQKKEQEAKKEDTSNSTTTD